MECLSVMCITVNWGMYFNSISVHHQWSLGNLKQIESGTALPNICVQGNIIVENKDQAFNERLEICDYWRTHPRHRWQDNSNIWKHTWQIGDYDNWPMTRKWAMGFGQWDLCNGSGVISCGFLVCNRQWSPYFQVIQYSVYAEYTADMGQLIWNFN